MSILQLDRGTRESQDLYIGAPGEITVDTSNQDIRLHDGITPGGKTIANRDNSDERYQARSPELDGILGFEPQNRGILVRRGPADYRLRTIGGSTSITVTNGDGYAGSPAVTLSAEVTSNHTFSGIETFTQQIQGSAGFAGDLTGNVTGNLAGNVTGNLEGNANGDSTGTFTGDVDTTDGTLLVADGQIHLAALNADATNYIQAAGVQPGSIVLWYGDATNIPAGWFICDGSNGTPDLRERFIIGANPDDGLDARDTGGNGVVTPTATSANAGSHTHTASGGAIAAAMTGITITKIDNPPVAGGGTQRVYRDLTYVDPGHTHDITGLVLDEAGVHNHVITVDQIEILPPYLALFYIMKGL